MFEDIAPHRSAALSIVPNALFRIAENPLTNYPRGGIIILYGNVYGNGNGNERHRQQTCVKTNVKSAPAPPGRAEHSLPRQSDG